MVWLYGLFVDKPGDYVKKNMQDCTAEETTQEWLYHMGVPVEDIPELAATGAKTVPVMMPYITAFFMPRQSGDRPDVVPAGSVNFAFIGQFAESKERQALCVPRRQSPQLLGSPIPYFEPLRQRSSRTVDRSLAVPE